MSIPAIRPILLLLVVLCGSLWGAPAEAACSGTGLAWKCTSGSSSGNVQGAIDRAANGATITFDDGAYNINVTLNRRNGISLICASVGGCTITSPGDSITIDTCGAHKTALIRVSGFVFSGAPSTGKIWFYCSDNYDITAVRIDHNSFTNFAGNQAVFFGETTKTSVVYGVVDHNTFTGATNGMAMKNISGGTTWTPGRRGTVNNLFFEDNTITFTDNTDLGLAAVDIWRANGTVLRFNKVIGSRLESHSLCHGGPTNFEMYGNSISNPTSSPPHYRNVHSQGSGETTWFNNTVETTGDGRNAIVLQHYRSDVSQLPQGACDPTEVCDGDFTSGSSIPQTDGNRSGQNGYPCWHQPGRDANAVLKPVYAWNNRTPGGAVLPINIQSGGLIASHLAPNRDYYNAVGGVQTSATSPFNGTVGMGFGTLANRPTTCTAGPGGADGANGGVAYWATDEGSWNANGEDGILYRCATTNTWVEDYTPYAYPHPLQSAAAAPPEAQGRPSRTRNEQ